MKRTVLVLLLIMTQAQSVFAGKIDKVFLKKLTGTKWELTGEKKFDHFFPKKNSKPIEQTITFSNGSILFDLTDQHYACNFTIKNDLEYWLYCTEPDQYIYKIRSLNTRVLVMDMFVKMKSGKYARTKRMTFHIKP